MKKTVFTSMLMCFLFPVFSQKNIYYLADTINVDRGNKVLEFKNSEYAFEHFFTFYCKCVAPHKDYVTFSYIRKKGEKKAEVVNRKPDYHYLSYKELMDVVSKFELYFSDNYNLYITEVMPRGRYRTNLVKFVRSRPPIDDSVIVPNKQ